MRVKPIQYRGARQPDGSLNVEFQQVEGGPWLKLLPRFDLRTPDEGNPEWAFPGGPEQLALAICASRMNDFSAQLTYQVLSGWVSANLASEAWELTGDEFDRALARLLERHESQFDTRTFSDPPQPGDSEPAEAAMVAHDATGAYLMTNAGFDAWEPSPPTCDECGAPPAEVGEIRICPKCLFDFCRPCAMLHLDLCEPPELTEAGGEAETAAAFHGKPDSETGGAE